MVRKRRKLKKKVKLFLYFLIFIIVVSFVSIVILKFNDKEVVKDNNNDKKEENKINSDDVIKEIVSYDIGVSEYFLKLIYNDYGLDVLLDLKEFVESNQYDESIWHQLTGKSWLVLNDLYNGVIDNSDNIKIVDSVNDTISFVGDVSLADDWYIIPKYEERGKGVYGILSESVVEIMKNTDVMVANNEFTISNRGSKMPKKYYTFRAKPERLSIYEEMGVDLVTLANNHIFDYGEEAFLDALTHLKEYNMPYIGAGVNLEEARGAYYFVVNGYKIAFVNATRAEKFILTPGATDTTPGVFRCYDPTNFVNTISEVKKNSDYVIVLMHWGREDSHELEQVQIDTGKMYIDAGADLLVGSHAHVLQGMEFYNGKLIAHNLGDFIFNRETKDTGIHRVIGTIIGGITGYVFLEFCYISQCYELMRIIVLPICILLVVYFCNVINRKSSVSIGCVVVIVILSRSVANVGSTLTYVIQRVCDTLIGIAVAMIVNKIDFKKVFNFKYKYNYNSKKDSGD